MIKAQTDEEVCQPPAAGIRTHGKTRMTAKLVLINAQSKQHKHDLPPNFSQDTWEPGVCAFDGSNAKRRD